MPTFQYSSSGAIPGAYAMSRSAFARGRGGLPLIPSMGEDRSGAVQQVGPLTTPGEAAWRYAGRSVLPLGPAFIDQPNTGTRGGFVDLLTKIPWLGKLFGTIGAYQGADAAQKKYGAGTHVYSQPESFLDRGLNTAGSVLQYMGGLGQGAKIAGDVVGALRGMRDLPGSFNTSFEQMFSELGGQALGRVLPSSSPNSNWSPALSESAFTSPSWEDTGFAGAQNFAPAFRPTYSDVG